ncbi:medium-chain acyl-CoA ligase ACSF2, mitochondrial-like isoform X2 [Branchiostoma floridae]|uniref:Medium-chain acyl-CoA ligase ACSF2, mitochondrial-like isoform X2 n=1 Tax=Branchiostoma floridae TaxID=7739 RepID=A0A9J7MML7_BRAFL|nr:medium-chain acyl-CoA ligase ACSF2, mitochondrial-like isoform X2 [Branchiostoma floridae]
MAGQRGVCVQEDRFKGHVCRHTRKVNTMSYMRGATDDLLLDVTFGQLLDDTAARWPDREAFVFKKTGSRVTFADIQEHTTRLAAGLKAIGTARGDVVAWLFGHRPEWIYLYFAVAKLGAIALPLQENRIGRNVEAMSYFLNKTGVKVLIMGDSGTESTEGTTSFLSTLFPEINTANPGMLKIERIPTLTSIVVLEDRATGTGVCTMEEVQRLGNDESLLAEVRTLQDQLSCHDTFFLRFTSGSTGQPKCAEISTYAVHNNARFINKAIGMPNEGTALYPYLTFRFAVIYPFTAGCTLVVPASSSPSSVEMLEILQEEKCKAIGVLYLKECHGLLHDPHLGDYDLSSLDRVLVTGNVTPKSLVDHAAKVLPNAKMFVGYGGTEFIFLTSTSAEKVAEGRGSTVGKLLEHAEMQLVDTDGRVVPLGHEGEVYVRAYSLFNGYRGDEEKTSKAMTADGWYKTGDVGVLDEEGVLKLFGRVSDMIIRNSFNVHPTAIESPLSKHPKVQDVRVVGVPDPASVEEICACVILKEGQTADSQEMTKFCAEIGLVPIEMPGYFLFMDEFPMTLTRRKVDRKKLRLIAMEKLGLKEEA